MPWLSSYPSRAFVAAAAAVTLVQCSSDHGAGHTDHPATGDGGPPSSTPIPAIAYDALYVVNGADASLSVINTETNEVAATIMLMNAKFPHHVSLSADRKNLFLAVPGMDMSAGHVGGMHGMPGAVMVMDALTGATVKARVFEMMNHNALPDPGGTEIWTSQMMAPGSVAVLDATTLETKQSIAVGDQPAEVTFSLDGRNAFVANGASNSVSVVDAVTKTVVKTIAVGEDPVGAWQGSNGIAYVDNEKAKTISAIDTQTLEIKLTYNLGFTPGMAALAPDGNLWVTDTDNGKLVMFKADADMKLGEVAMAAGAHAIAFSGDKKTGYVSNQMAASVSVIDIATQAVTKTIAVGAKPNGMVWRAK
jgi:YVTN family beta-propeller protein